MVDSVLFLSITARQNKKLIEITTSKVHEWKDRWCWAYSPAFPYQNTPWRTSLPKLPPKKALKKELSEAESLLVQFFDQRLKEGRLWDVNMKPSLSSSQWAGIVSGSTDLSFPELELSSSSFLSIGGGGSVRFHGLDDDDVRSYVGSEEAKLRTPPLQDLTGIPSLDETGMTKGRRFQLPSAAFVRGGRGRRGTGGRGCPDSPDRARVNTRDFDDRDRRSSCDVEDRPPKPLSTDLVRGKEVASDYPRESQKRCQLTGGRESAVPLGGSTCGFSSSMTPTSYAKEQFKYEMVDGHRVELDPIGYVLLRELHFAGPQPKICGLPQLDDGFICCESNALALVVSQEAIVDRDAAWKKVKNLEEEITGLRKLHKELTANYNASQDFVQRLEDSLKKAENQSTSRLTALEKAQSRCEELERKIESEEGKAAIIELARPSSKAGYNMAYQHFASYLSEVPADKKWDGLPRSHDDIGVTDQNIPYYIVDGPPPPIAMDAEEEGEPGEVNIVDP
ncbi:hypothetical protein Dimus_000945 [Dionaea muscipula]